MTRKFSVDEYHRMIRAGILDENDNVELIRGDIVLKPLKTARRCSCVDKINDRFFRLFRDRAIVSIHNPVCLSDSEPEPAVMLLKPKTDFYESGKPRAGDVLLLAEVSDTNIQCDRGTRMTLYAEAGIGEYWILNLNDDTLEVHRQPQTNGTYADIRILRRGDQMEIAALPGVIVQVAELL
jgi:Uma2 family endonuclease